MSMKRIISAVIGLGACGLTGMACIQTMWMQPPKDPRQLPAEIFKVHVHIAAPPVEVQMALPGGTVTVPLGKTATDPQADFTSLISKYESDPASHQSFAERNDYAAALLFALRYANAIPVLLQLELDFPGKYSTASNLGTAYELAGDDSNAALWIQRGIDRNAGSHQGTEWLHLAILDAKQKLKADPGWLNRHSVLDGHENIAQAEKERALDYQLNERLYFIHENDAVMCDLFYQAAVIASDPGKKAYFFRQVPRFGSIRDAQMRKLQRG